MKPDQYKTHFALIFIVEYVFELVKLQISPILTLIHFNLNNLDNLKGYENFWSYLPTHASWSRNWGTWHSFRLLAKELPLYQWLDQCQMMWSNKIQLQLQEMAQQNCRRPGSSREFLYSLREDETTFHLASRKKLIYWRDFPIPSFWMTNFNWFVLLIDDRK